MKCRLTIRNTVHLTVLLSAIVRLFPTVWNTWEKKVFHHNAKTPAMPLTAFGGGGGGGEASYSVLHYFQMILHIARESANECRKIGLRY